MDDVRISEEKLRDKSNPYSLIATIGFVAAILTWIVGFVIDFTDDGSMYMDWYATWYIIGYAIIAAGVLSRKAIVVMVGAIFRALITFYYFLDWFIPALKGNIVMDDGDVPPILKWLCQDVLEMAVYLAVILAVIVSIKKEDSSAKKLPVLLGFVFSIAYFGWNTVSNIGYAGEWIAKYATGLVAFVLLFAWIWKADMYVEKTAAEDASVKDSGNETTEPKMKFCSHCGTEIFAAAVICPHCGCPVEGACVPNTDDTPSTGLNIISLLLPIVGLILYLVYHDKTPKKAKAIGKFALIGFGIGIVAAVIYYVAVIGMFMAY
jgi:hypothetical protein